MSAHQAGDTGFLARRELERDDGEWFVLVLVGLRFVVAVVLDRVVAVGDVRGVLRADSEARPSEAAFAARASLRRRLLR